MSTSGADPYSRMQIARASSLAIRATAMGDSFVFISPITPGSGSVSCKATCCPESKAKCHILGQRKQHGTYDTHCSLTWSIMIVHTRLGISMVLFSSFFLLTHKRLSYGMHHSLTRRSTMINDCKRKPLDSKKILFFLTKRYSCSIRRKV
jgi:hypothetical protein